MLFVDGRVRWLLPLERQSENCLARRPDNALKTAQPRRLEDVVRAEHVRLEGRLLGVDARSRNGREVNDGVSARKALDSLAELGQVGEQRRRR